MGNQMEQIDWKELLETQPSLPFDVSLAFNNLGDVGFTTITRANLALLRRARECGHPGIIVSCPDFERESLAIVFLASLLHLTDGGEGGAHKVRAGEVASVGRCVFRVSEVTEESVKFTQAAKKYKRNRGLVLSLARSAVPVVHTCGSDTELTRREDLPLYQAAREYRELPESVRTLQDMCGKSVPAVGYVTSPSMYLNEAPTYVQKGDILIDGNSIPLADAIPITYLTTTGERKSGFGLPFEAPPSLVVAPREDGMGDGYPLIEYVRDGGTLDFVSFDVPGPEFLDTTLVDDIDELVDKGVALIGFCDRWTLDRVKPLEEKGFLVFDWDRCDAAGAFPGFTLSKAQMSVAQGRHETAFPVEEGDTGISQAKSMIYDKMGRVPLPSDDVMAAKETLFRVLGSVIRRTEIPTSDYCAEQRRAVDEALSDIKRSGILSNKDWSDLRVACERVKECLRSDRALPKEDAAYETISGRLLAGQAVVLVVDRSRSGSVRDYWVEELEYNDCPVDRFSVLNTREFMAEKGLQGDECAVFSGWYDRGTMDRALHSGIASDVVLLLYSDGQGGLEIEWWQTAKRAWRLSSYRCAQATRRTLRELSIVPYGQEPKKPAAVAAARSSILGGERDDSPTAVVTDVVARRIQRDVARGGERSVRAVPIIFDDGSHVWLTSSEGRRGASGRLTVITDCLEGLEDEPVKKSASAVLRGDVVLVTHSNRDYIVETAEQGLSNYDQLLDMAQAWRGPVDRAKRRGLTEREIVDAICGRLPGRRREQTVRSWISGNRIAPQSEDDIRAVYLGLGERVTDAEVKSIAAAAERIRTSHRLTGRMASEKMVGKFIDDVRVYGVEDAVNGFGIRHRTGVVELLTVRAVGEPQYVSVERAEIV